MANVVENADGTVDDQTLMTFEVPNNTDAATWFEATINWGDGTTSVGTISGANGLFTVAGGHTYATPGGHVVRVTIEQHWFDNVIALTLATTVPLGSSGGSSKKGTPNAKTVMAELVKEYAIATTASSPRYWLVVFSNAEPKEPDGVAEAKQGHAWLAVIDVKTKTLTSVGLAPKNDSDLSFSSPATPGVYRDDSEMKYTAARGYQLKKDVYLAWVKYLAKEKASSPTYNMLSNNCTTWVIKSCPSQVYGVAPYRGNLLGDGDLADVYVPRSLAVFLIKPKPGTRPFSPTMPK